MYMANPFLATASMLSLIFLGVLIPIVAIMSFLFFVLYMVSNKKIRPMQFFYVNMPIALVLSMFYWWFEDFFNHIVDLYCVLYIAVMFFVVLRGIFLNKNMRLLDYTKILIPLFITVAFLLIKAYGISYDLIVHYVFLALDHYL